jgi:hypothetical protein
MRLHRYSIEPNDLTPDSKTWINRYCIVRSLVAKPAQWRPDMRTLKRRDYVMILASVAYQATVVEAPRFTVAIYH